MANARRGEIAACFDGAEYTLCLTLGALAELEQAFGAGDLTQLVERFASGRLSAADLVTIIAAGLRGAGHEVTRAEVTVDGMSFVPNSIEVPSPKNSGLSMPA